MSKVKSGGSTKNNRDSAGKRLGVKLFGGQKVTTGQIIVRQVGANKVAGDGTFMSKNFTIHAAKDGVVKFNKNRKFKKFTGKSAPRTEVSVV
jgi:large subunit ribosomal protein L27